MDLKVLLTTFWIIFLAELVKKGSAFDSFG